MSPARMMLGQVGATSTPSTPTPTPVPATAAELLAAMPTSPVVVRGAVAKRTNFDGCNIVTDGNSISANYFDDTIDDLVHQRMTTLGIAGNATFSSKGGVAIGGQTWNDMKNQHADLDALWVDGKTNYLICNETTNAIFNGMGVDRAVADARAYMAAVKAAHPWRILVWGTIPRGHANEARTAGDADKNRQLLEVDRQMLADPAFGYEAFVPVRGASPMFNHDGTKPDPFRAYKTIWRELEDGTRGSWDELGWCHPYPGDWTTGSTPATGKKAIAAAIVDGLQAMGV